ncbi:MAG: hypothetical protein R6U10_04410 [Thermoplasmatota archaeon]
MVGLSLLLAAVSALSFSRARDLKLALLTTAFGLFVAKGVLLLLGVVEQSISLVGLDLCIIGFLYLATAKR